MRFRTKEGYERMVSPTTNANSREEAEEKLTTAYQGFGAYTIEVTRVDVMESWGLWETAK